MIIGLLIGLQTSPMTRPQPVLLSAAEGKEAFAAIQNYVGCLDRATAQQAATASNNIIETARAIRTSCLDEKAEAVRLEIKEYELRPEYSQGHSFLSSALRVIESFDADVDWKIANPSCEK